MLRMGDVIKEGDDAWNSIDVLGAHDLFLVSAFKLGDWNLCFYTWFDFITSIL